MGQYVIQQKPGPVNYVASTTERRKTKCVCHCHCAACKAITDRSFQYASPRLWNQLPASLRQPRTNLPNHRRNFVCDDGDLSPPLLKVVVTVTTTFQSGICNLIRQITAEILLLFNS